MTDHARLTHEAGGWAPKPPDTVTPHQQSLLVMEHLSSGQLMTYRRSSGLPADASRQEAAIHFARHRVTALQEAAAFRERTANWQRTRRKTRPAGRCRPLPALPESAQAELESAQDVGHAAGRIPQTLSTWCGIAGFVIGWGFLLTAVVGMVPGLHLLLMVSAVCLVLSLLLMAVIAPALYAQAQRASREALFEWAVHRPGQLERGLPGLHKRVDEDATLGGTFCLGLIIMAIGGFCGLMGLVMVPIALFDQKAVTWQITGILGVISAVMLVSPRVVGRWSQWVRRRNDEIDEAVSWVYSPAEPTDL